MFISHSSCTYKMNQSLSCVSPKLSFVCQYNKCLFFYGTIQKNNLLLLRLFGKILLILQQNLGSFMELSPQTADYPLICIVNYRIF